MDHTMIDLTDAGDVPAGERVVLFGGAAPGADELAGWCETIAYEMLTSVGRRVPRVCVEDLDA
jgi:alanine racemase